MIPRWAHRLYARILGYFWLPCPRCGRWFGGHEALPELTLVWGGYKILCPTCTRAGHTMRVEDQQS